MEGAWLLFFFFQFVLCLGALLSVFIADKALFQEMNGVTTRGAVLCVRERLYDAQTLTQALGYFTSK